MNGGVLLGQVWVGRRQVLTLLGIRGGCGEHKRRCLWEVLVVSQLGSADRKEL